MCVHTATVYCQRTPRLWLSMGVSLGLRLVSALDLVSSTSDCLNPGRHFDVCSMWQSSVTLLRHAIILNHILFYTRRGIEPTILPRDATLNDSNVLFIPYSTWVRAMSSSKNRCCCGDQSTISKLIGMVPIATVMMSQYLYGRYSKANVKIFNSIHHL